ncbi:hypothetical protein KR044_010493, partial [Drosophila immigrans]
HEHHRHHLGHNQYNGPPPFGPVRDPVFGGYGDQLQGGRYPGQEGAAFGSQVPSGVTDFGGRGFDRRPGFGHPDQPMAGYRGGVSPYQNGRGSSYGVAYPLPTGPVGFGQHDHGLSGYAGSPLQPRPGQGHSYPGGFQQPSHGPSESFASTLQPRSEPGSSDLFGFQQPGDAGSPLQPHPDQGQLAESYPGGYQQPSISRPLQPRPGQRQPYPGGFQQPSQDQSETTLQPRPGSSDVLGFQQPGNAGSPLQPRPDQGQLEESFPGGLQQPSIARPLQPRPGQRQPYPGGFQQSSRDQSETTLQPRPGSSDGLGFQQPGNAGSPFQPRPDQDHLEESFTGGLQQPSPGQSESVAGTLQPRPGSSDVLGFQQPGDAGSPLQPRPEQSYPNNILSIFNTKDSRSSQSKEGIDEGEKSGVQPISIEGRFLLSTDPKCHEGSDVRGGRCRQNA